ncbi:MAG: HEAT repeat domain-containing protein [Chlamydiota bacterium]
MRWLKLHKIVAGLVLWVSCSVSLYGNNCIASEKFIQRVDDYLLLGDSHAALQEAQRGVECYPQHSPSYAALIRAYALFDPGSKMMEAWRSYSRQFPEESYDPLLLEDMAWGILRQGGNSSNFNTQLFGVLGAALTRDIYAVPLLMNALDSSSAPLRRLACQLTPLLGDEVLKAALLDKLTKEKSLQVRIALINTLGALEYAPAGPVLSRWLDSEERREVEIVACVHALGKIFPRPTDKEVYELGRSALGAERMLACWMVAEFRLDGLLDEVVIPLLKDAQPIVRAAAAQTEALLDRPTEQLNSSLGDLDYRVRCSAAWGAAGSLADIFDPLLFSSDQKCRYLAAGVLATLGERGAEYAAEVLESSEDPWVRLNLAIGLIGQRYKVKQASEALLEALESDERMMWAEQGFISYLAPSEVEFNPLIPNYPEVVNQSTRLDLLNILAVVDHDQAQDAIMSFLQQPWWGITGLAATNLLEEGSLETVELLEELLNSEDSKVRVQAALVLALQGRDPQAVPVLEEAFDNVDRSLQLVILEASGRVGDPNSLPFLVGVLDSPFQSLRFAAASSLIQCLNH